MVKIRKNGTKDKRFINVVQAMNRVYLVKTRTDGQGFLNMPSCMVGKRVRLVEVSD